MTNYRRPFPPAIKLEGFRSELIYLATTDITMRAFDAQRRLTQRFPQSAMVGEVRIDEDLLVICEDAINSPLSADHRRCIMHARLAIIRWSPNGPVPGVELRIRLGPPTKETTRRLRVDDMSKGVRTAEFIWPVQRFKVLGATLPRGGAVDLHEKDHWRHAR